MWNGLILSVAKDQIGVAVWIRSDTTVFPGPATAGRSLPFDFRGATVRSARVFEVRALNAGRTLIGSPESLWHLTLSTPPAARVALLAPPLLSPQSLVARAREDSLGHSIIIDLGAFEPRAYVDLVLLLVDLNPAQSLEVSSSLVGLPRTLTPQPPQEAVRDRIWLSLWPFSIVLVLLIFYRLINEDVTDKRDKQKPLGRYFLGVAALVLAMSAGAARLLAYGMAWLVVHTQ